MRDRTTREVRCVICNLPVQIEGPSSAPPAAPPAAPAETQAAAPSALGGSAASPHGSSPQAAVAAPGWSADSSSGTTPHDHEQHVLRGLQHALLQKLAQVTECLGAQHPGSSAGSISEQLQLAGQLLQALRAAKDAAAPGGGSAAI